MTTTVETGSTNFEDLETGMKVGFRLDGEWVWTARNGRVNGVLIAAPCHGLVHLLRLVVRPGAPFETTLLLFRRFVRDCRKRGMNGAFVFLAPEHVSWIRRMGGVPVGEGNHLAGVFGLRLGRH